MKKQAIILAALLGAASAQAQVYGSVAVGSTNLALDCAGATVCDKTDTGMKVVGGYGFGNGFSLEAGYVSFGKFRGSDGLISATIKPTAFTVAGAFALPLNTDWGMNFRLGLAQVKTKIDAAQGALQGSASQSKASAYAGLGVTYAVSKDIKLEAAIDSTQAKFDGESGTVRMFSVGATFGF